MWLQAGQAQQNNDGSRTVSALEALDLKVKVHQLEGLLKELLKRQHSRSSLHLQFIDIELLKKVGQKRIDVMIVDGRPVDINLLLLLLELSNGASVLL